MVEIYLFLGKIAWALLLLTAIVAGIYYYGKWDTRSVEAEMRAFDEKQKKED